MLFSYLYDAIYQMHFPPNIYWIRASISIRRWKKIAFDQSNRVGFMALLLIKQKCIEPSTNMKQLRYVFFLKFVFSEKATKLCEIFTLLLTVCTVVKSKVKISQNFMNLNCNLKLALRALTHSLDGYTDHHLSAKRTRHSNVW